MLFAQYTSKVTYENADSPHLLLNLSHLTQLRSIQVGLRYSSPIASITGLLSQISSPRLERVAFHLSYAQDAHSPDIRRGWEEVDAMLQSSPFDGLKEVHFDCTHQFGTSVTDYLLCQMSQCRARGIMTIRDSMLDEFRFYGMGAGELYETYGCGLDLFTHSCRGL